MLKKLVTVSLFVLLTTIGLAQVGIGTTSPHKSSVLDVESTTKGFLPPRVSNHSVVNNPASGLMVYDQSDNCINVFNGSTWVNLCTNDGSQTGSQTPSNPNLTFDCSGVFNNTSTFGASAFHNGTRTPGYHKFAFHLNEDGSILYNNHGYYHDTTSSLHDNSPTGYINMTTQTKAVNQIFPNKKWKNFIALDIPLQNSTGNLFLLSTDGELYSTCLTEYSGASKERIAYSTDEIDPTDDNDMLLDVNSSASDYRFTPYAHLANGNDPSIKFSSLYYSVPERSTSTGQEITVFAYDGTHKKFYSFGARKPTTLLTTKISAFRLGRTTLPSSLKESLTLKEADLINRVISHFGTEFKEPTNGDVTFLAYSGSRYYFITTDGYLNILYGSTIIHRYQLPNNVNFKSILAGTAHPYLGDDGKLYRLKGNLNASDYTLSNISVSGIGTMSLRIPNYPIELSAPENSELGGLNLAQAYIAAAPYINARDTDGKLYYINYGTGVITNNYTDDYNVPLVTEILSSNRDMIVKDASGTVFGVSYSSSTRHDLPNKAIGSSSIGYDGTPIIDEYNNRVRLLFSCFGN